MFENDGKLTDELDKDPSEWMLSFTILETPADSTSIVNEDVVWKSWWASRALIATLVVYPLEELLPAIASLFELKNDIY